MLSTTNAQVSCNQGDQNSPGQKTPGVCPIGDLTPVEEKSYDPNELIGPEGYDSVRWVSINDVLRYTIMFENDPEFATAAAQVVDVRFNFPNKNMMRGFGISDYSFSNQAFTVPTPSNAYQTRIDLRDSLGFFVDLIGGLDQTRQQGFWKFMTIDPMTGYAPTEVYKGLLPVNDSTHVGEGYVTFQMTPTEDMQTGDTISFAANIVFDTNDTIPTNRWRVTVDAGAPQSKVQGTPILSPQGGTTPTSYQLTFTANDDEGGSGVKHVLLYLANNMGIYEETDTVAVDSVLLFPVEQGKQYKLYSIAVDNVGNREPAKMEPDVILNFNLAPTDIVLSDTTFQDDIATGGFIAELTSEDVEQDGSFTYALAEGDGAIHNDLFQVSGTQLQAKQPFKCAGDTCYQIRLSTTDEGGLSFSKAFNLDLKKVLVRPKVDTLNVTLCDGETCLFKGMEYTETGQYKSSKENEYMCDSLFVLNLTILPKQEIPLVSVEGTHTLVSSAAKGNQWFREDGTPIAEATDQKFTPEEDGIYYVAVSNGVCYSEPSQLYQVRLSDYIDLRMDLKTGWNWVSSSLSEPANQDAKQFLQPIADITERFVGQQDELINDPVYGLTGGLTTIAPTESYKLQVSENNSNVWSGNGSNPETTTFNLRKGWNWIGYVPIRANTLSAALTGITPSENDIIKCIDEFATFTGGNWVGTLTQLKPGEGYLYYSGKNTTFKYPAMRAFPVESDQTPMAARSYGSPWHYDAHGAPDNTTLIGQLYADGSLTLEGTYTVGAFCGNECRGVGKYVDNKLFMTIHGTVDKSETINFKAYENATGQEYNISESIAFNGQQEGNFISPIALHISGATGISEISDKFTIYPRPLHSRLYVNGETTNIKSILVLSTDGSVNISQMGYYEDGIDVSILLPGVYVVAITLDNGKVYYEKVIKAQN
ncbi:MAG: T9SS type A sorting domain-containing protein [Prevotella sp.]|nr:T9SS type A sorting domain-containing protein [Prevotella sp.]